MDNRVSTAASQGREAEMNQYNGVHRETRTGCVQITLSLKKEQDRVQHRAVGNGISSNNSNRRRETECGAVIKCGGGLHTR
jgi:hypothetical protein